MSLYPLDAVRNARIDWSLEPVLEEMAHAIGQFPFPDTDLGNAADARTTFGQTRPLLNVLLGLLGCPSRPGADISTGLGVFPALLAMQGIPVLATERDPDVSTFAHEYGVEVLPYTIGEPSPFEPASLDFIVFSQVLEHLKKSPIRVVQELSVLLHSGGRLLLSTPNVARLSNLQRLCSGENFLEEFSEEGPMQADATDFIDHVREYSVREVVDAIEAAGLEVGQVLMTSWGEAGYDPLPNPYTNEIIVAEAVK